MSKASLNNLLELLDVRLDAFAMCEVGHGFGLSVPASEKIVVHYVLQGKGSIECCHGTFPVEEGMVAVIPKELAKQINGNGPVATVIDAQKSCPLIPGMIRFQAREAEGDVLILGCASVSATVGDGLGLFDHLQQPLVERPKDESLPALFRVILRELAGPGIGTKQIVEAHMKQLLILLLRNHLKRAGLSSPLYLPLMNPQLGKALTAMLARPQDSHSVDSLARLASMSRSRFTHHFAATYGTSPMDYLQSVRLRKAAMLLRSSTAPVKLIAVQVGFSSRSHFSRLFAAKFGMDPTRFREATSSTEPQMRSPSVEHSELRTSGGLPGEPAR